MEKISVIVPYYNSSIFLLRKCLFSLIAQTYKNIEIMVVIDGATKMGSLIQMVNILFLLIVMIM